MIVQKYFYTFFGVDSLATSLVLFAKRIEILFSKDRSRRFPFGSFVCLQLRFKVSLLRPYRTVF